MIENAAIPQSKYVFGPFRLDVEQHRLLRKDESGQEQQVQFSKQKRLILGLLLEHRNEVVKYEIIWKSCWPGEKDFVRYARQHKISVHIDKIREVLEDYGECIEPNRGIGYYFNDQTLKNIEERAILQSKTLEKELLPPQLPNDPPGEGLESNAPNKNDSPVEPESKTFNRQKLIYSSFIKAIALTCVLLGVSGLEKRTALGKSIESTTYSILQHRLSSTFAESDLPVVLVDISDLPQFSANANQIPYTSRQVLQEFIAAAAGSGARSIGIDLDFSPAEEGYISPDDLQFFQFCLELKKTIGVPIFLGIYRSQSMPASAWLGEERYKELAATIITPRDGRRMVRWFQTANSSEASFSIGASLASAFKNSKHERNSPLGWAVQSESDLKQPYFPGKEFLVDYSPLIALESQMLRTKDPSAIRDQGRRLQGKIVLFGDVTSGRTRDTVVVPGRRDPVPGALVHACAIYTLLKGPLYSLTLLGHAFVDLIISLMIFGGIAALQIIISKKRGSTVALTSNLQGIVLGTMAIIVIVAGWIFVDKSRLIWDDLFLVTAVLLAYGPVERGCRYLRHAAAYSWRVGSTSQAEGDCR